MQYSLDNELISFDNINHFFIKKINIVCDDKNKKSHYIIFNQKVKYNQNCDYSIGDKKLNLYENILMSRNIDSDFSKNILDFSYKFNFLSPIE